MFAIVMMGSLGTHMLHMKLICMTTKRRGKNELIALLNYCGGGLGIQRAPASEKNVT